MGLFSSIGGILGGAVGSIFGPVGSVIGSAIGGAGGGAVDANQANKKTEGYYNQQMDFANQQAQFQQDYAKHVMEWRVEDAKNAGVHPMAALGISNPSYSPVSAPSAPEIFDSGQVDTGSTFGQSLNRASMQAKTMQQQEQAVKLGFQTVALQNKGLELDNLQKSLQVMQMVSDLQRNAASSAPAPKVNNQAFDGLPEAGGLISNKDDTYHIWDMGNGEFDILMNPDYQQTIGDEFGQVATSLKAATRAGNGLWIDPKNGVSYVYNASSGYWRRLSSLSPEEAKRYLGSSPSHSSGASPSSSHMVKNRYRYRY